MKQGNEQVREVGSTRQSGGFKDRERDLSIGDVLRKHHRELITKRMLVVTAVILVILLVVILSVNGFFDRMFDTLMGSVD